MIDNLLKPMECKGVSSRLGLEVTFVDGSFKRDGEVKQGTENHEQGRM